MIFYISTIYRPTKLYCTPEEITSFNYSSIAVEQSEALESDLRDFTRR